MQHIIIARTTVRLIEYFKGYTLRHSAYFGLRNDNDNKDDVDLSVSNKYNKSDTFFRPKLPKINWFLFLFLFFAWYDNIFQAKHLSFK